MNKFFNPDECPFEILGFFEDLMDSNGKFIGHRTIETPDRPLGSMGMKEYIITENLNLRKAGRDVIFKASPQKPKHITGMIQILCGRVKK